MPVNYLLRCSKCLKQRAAGAGYLAVQQDNGEVQPLCHPGEASDLARKGFDEKQAYADARIIFLREYVCPRCGKVYVGWQFKPPPKPLPTGCGPFASLFALLFGGFGLWLAITIGWRIDSGWGWGTGILPFAVLWLVVRTRIDDWRQARRYKMDIAKYAANLCQRPPLPQERCCPAWDKDTLVPIEQAYTRGPFHCPDCGADAVECHGDGIS